MESSAVGECDETEPNALNEAESGATETSKESSAAEANTTQTSKPPKKKSGQAGKPKKKPRLCDVVEQSNEQMQDRCKITYRVVQLHQRHVLKKEKKTENSFAKCWV